MKDIEKLSNLGTDVILNDLIHKSNDFGDMKCIFNYYRRNDLFLFMLQKELIGMIPYPEYGEYAREEKERLEDYTYYKCFSK